MDAYSQIIDFARAHRGEDPVQLLLQQQRYPATDLRLVAQQLEGMRQAPTKWPTLARHDNYFYPPRSNREQSSSEATALYKTQLFHALGCSTFADLTGGMGVDTYFLSKEASQGNYFEVDKDLFLITQRNLASLGANNIICRNGDSLSYFNTHDCHFDLLLIDPARRDPHGRKMAAFEDCTPNLLECLELLRPRCRFLMIKASPMIDINMATHQLRDVAEVHVVALRNECKEVLFLIPGNERNSGGKACSTAAAQPKIQCIQLHPAGQSSFGFCRDQEETSVPTLAHTLYDYLYEPNAAIMKGGGYNLVSSRFNIHKLARNTHLYTSDRLVDSFPGRTFQILQEIPLNAKKVARHIPERKAHVIVRNYPLTAAELQKRLRIAEGGELYIIAATFGSTPMGWLCRKINKTH